MRKQINLICSLLALFCFISMYMPVIAPRYPAGEYYPAAENYTDTYFYTGNYYCARECWSITRFVFANNNVIPRVVLSLCQAMLLLWALMSVRGEAGRMGLYASVMNLAVTAFFIICMMRVMWSCRWGVLVMQGLTGLAAVVMAANAKGAR